MAEDQIERPEPQRSAVAHEVARAAASGDPTRVKVLLDAGFDADPSGATSEWQWPLYRAVDSGSIATVQVLLEAGAELNKRFGRFCEPLLARARSPEMLELLLESGAVVEPTMVAEQGPYDRANGALRVLSGIAIAPAPMSSEHATTDISVATRTEMVLRVIEARSITPEEVGRALREVVFRSQADATEVLLAAGADPHAQPHLLNAVCFRAESDEDDGSDPERVVRSLLEAGLDPDDEDERGFRPLHTAVSPGTFGSGYQESDGYNGLAALGLIRGGADVDIAFPETDVEQLEPPKVAGWTPLHVAAHRGDRQVVEALLEAGADPRAITPTGRTALDHAAARLAWLTDRVVPRSLPDDAAEVQTREYDARIVELQLMRTDAEVAVSVLRAAGG